MQPARPTGESPFSPSTAGRVTEWDVGTDVGQSQTANPWGASPRIGRAPSPDSWSEVEHDVSSPTNTNSTFELHQRNEEIFEESSDPWDAGVFASRQEYKQGGSIDWMHEEAAERAFKQHLRSQRGLRGLFLPLIETWRMWFVLIATGVSIGYTGAWLDVLVAWLSDIRLGRCTYGIFYNQAACCSGLDPGQVCYEWATWSDYYEVKSIAGQAMLQSFLYVAFATVFAGAAAFLVQHYAPYAFHTGIPEIKAILGGYLFDDFLGPWTLLIKAVGLALSVASGLSLGKEGPLVHVSCCTASLLLSLVYRSPSKTGSATSRPLNQAQLRKTLAAAATAGVAVAFGSPLGGVLFGLEELDTNLFNNQHLMWRAFVTSAVAATALAYIDPFGSGKLTLFQVTASQQWHQFELVAWLGIGVAGGVLGTLLIRLNVRAAVFRKRSPLRDMPLFEVLLVTAVTAIISYPIVFMRDQSSTLVSNLFQECDPARDYHGLCNPASMWANIFLLLITAFLKIGLTAYTFGLNVPAGIFLPTIAIGASLGRSVGIFLQEWHKAYPRAWVFSACPPEGICIYPGFYAVVGAAAMLGGVTRMTVSLVVIIFELTGALSHVLPIMLAVMASKFVGDYFGKGIYDTWIAMRGYPYLPPSDYRDRGETAATVMIPAANIVTVNGRQSLASELDALLEGCDYDGFPVVDGEMLLGYVTRPRLRQLVAPLVSETTVDGHNTSNQDALCTFIKNLENFDGVDLSSALQEAPIQLKMELPLEVVVSMFQRLNLQYVLFTSRGQLTGMMTKRDVVSLMNEGFHEDRFLSGDDAGQSRGRTAWEWTDVVH